MWNEEQRKSVWDYARKKASREEMLKALSIPPDDVVSVVYQQLSDAIDTRDGELISDVRWIAQFLQVDMRSYLDLVERLFGEDWHRQQVHEEFIHALQVLADPSTVPLLRMAIALKPKVGWEGDYTTDRNFFQRCSHALNDIDTSESLALIEECSHANDEALRDEALYRLIKIHSGEAKPLIDARDGISPALPDAVERKIQRESYYDIRDAFGESRGVESVKLAHSLIVEACMLYSAACGYDVYSELIAAIDAPKASFANIVDRERWFVRLYLFLSVNIRFPIKSKDNLKDTREYLPYNMYYMLRDHGAEAKPAYNVFRRAMVNVEEHALPSVYWHNEHTLKASYRIANDIER